MFRTPVDGFFSRLFKGSKHGSSYRGQNYIENELRGNENWFELAGVRVIEGSSYRESTVYQFIIRDVWETKNLIQFSKFRCLTKSF